MKNSRKKSKSKLSAEVGSYRELFNDFVANSSIRGLKRTLFSPNRTLRAFWTIFLLGSFTLAVSQVAFLLEKYLKRETTVQQQKAFGHLEAFPAVSFCVSDPFSDNAAALWRQGAVESPNNFSQRLRTAALRLMQTGGDAGRRQAARLLRLDQREAYFQNVENQSLLTQLGHAKPFFFCAINPFDHGQPVFHNYDKNTCNLTVVHWLHPIYLNCYTLSFASDAFSKALKSIFLVLPAGRSEPRDGVGPYENASFLRDTLKKYTTLQVVMHEASKKPNFDETVMLTAHQSDINVISFTTSKYVNNDCSRVGSSESPESKHAGSNPNDFDACLEDSIERDVINRCACTQRLDRPDPGVPFCFAINWTNLAQTFRKLSCSLSGGTYLTSFAAASRACPRPCESIVYEVKVLRSSNRVTAWQECWYMWLFMDSTVNKSQLDKYLLMHLNTTANDFDDSVCRHPWYHRLPYVKLKIVRQDFTTRTFNETLVLTSAALFAQVGAALAFYIGLTLTFVAELVDLAIRLYRQFRKRQQERTTSAASSKVAACPDTDLCIVNSNRDADNNFSGGARNLSHARSGDLVRACDEVDCSFDYADEDFESEEFHNEEAAEVVPVGEHCA